MTQQQHATLEEISEYYLDVVANQATSKTYDKFMISASEFFEEFAEQVQGDVNLVMSRYQDLLDREIVEYPIAEIMANAPLQMQRGLDIKRLAYLWTDTKVSIQKVGCLLKLPTIAIRPDGSKILVGGNHSIAAIIVPLLQNGLDPELLSEIPVKVLQISVNTDMLRELLGDGASNAEVHKEANNILAAYWWADNHTRSMSTSEYSDAESFRLDIDASDPVEVLDAAFGDVKKIDKKTAFRYLVVQELLETMPDERLLESSEVPNGSLPVVFVINEQDKALTISTLEQITKAFLTTLGGFHEVRHGTNKKGEAVERKLRYWSRDLSDSSEFHNIAQWFTSQLESGINDYLASLPAEDEYSNNVSRNAVAIGKAIAETLNDTSHPVDDPRVEKPKATKSKGKRTKSLGLAM